jgi:pyridoxal phosphate enzyme (YggS family)
MISEPSARVAELAGRIERVRAAIDAAAVRAGRSPKSVTLVGVTKTTPATIVYDAARLGLTRFGENRIQEALPKIAEVQTLATPGELARIRWHFIGHLQTNKARAALESFATIESVDSLRLAQTVDRLAAERGEPASVLLEVNVGEEPSKQGFRPGELLVTFGALRSLGHLRIGGLMTVAPLVEQPEPARPYFRQLRELRDRLVAEHPGTSLPELSMGMSGDYPVAIEEGATLVRIGRAIFGERPQFAWSGQRKSAKPGSFC